MTQYWDRRLNWLAMGVVAKVLSVHWSRSSGLLVTFAGGDVSLSLAQKPFLPLYACQGTDFITFVGTRYPRFAVLQCGLVKRCSVAI